MNKIQEGNQQFKPYAGEIHPEANFPPGSYLEVDHRSSNKTANESLWAVWAELNASVQTFSALPASINPFVTADVVRGAFDALQRGIVVVAKKIKSRSGDMFSSTFGAPPVREFVPYPIRWCGENPVGLEIVLKFVESIHQVAFLHSNVLQKGIPHPHAMTILKPLIVAKSTLMEEYFGLEVKGDISPDELQAIFRGSSLLPPLPSSISDRHDTRADLQAEDEAAMGVTSMPRPTADTLEAAQAGVDPWTFMPGETDYTTLAAHLQRLEVEGPRQHPGQPWPFPGEGAIGSGSSSTSSGGSSRVE